MELYHYGVKGQRWGVRRYQNKDGTLTAAGKQHYRSDRESDNALMSRDQVDLYKDIRKKSGSYAEEKFVSKRFKDAARKYLADMEKVEQEYDDTKYSADMRRAEDEYQSYVGSYIKRNEKGWKKLKNERDNIDKIYPQMSYQERNKKFDELTDAMRQHDKQVHKMLNSDEQFIRIKKKLANLAFKDELARKARVLHPNDKEQKRRIDELRASFEQQLSGIILEDLGYNNTEAGRQYLIDNHLWDGTYM